MPYMISRPVTDGISLSVITGRPRSKLVYSSLTFVVNKLALICLLTHTHTHTFNGPLSRTTQVGRYQKGKTNLDFTEARDSEWQ